MTTAKSTGTVKTYSPNGRRRRRESAAAGIYVNALVNVSTYKFLADYRGDHSFGVGLDNLVGEVNRLRLQVKILLKKTQQVQEKP